MIKLNGKEINPTMFPDGTSQVWKVEGILEYPHHNFIHWNFEHEFELMHVMQLNDLCREIGSPVHLNLPYLPYARQDKGVTNETTFALNTFARIINSGHFYQINVFDAHSNAYMDIHYCYNTMPDLSFVKDYSLVCFPDKGAMNRYARTVSLYNNQTFYAEKVRDQKTGWITHYDIISKYQPTDLNVIVVDDLCDGGMTFNILADSLQDMGVGQLDLYVSHGIFSKGVEELLTKYDNIITTDTRFANVDLDIAAAQSNKWKSIRDSVNDGRLTIRKAW